MRRLHRSRREVPASIELRRAFLYFFSKFYILNFSLLSSLICNNMFLSNLGLVINIFFGGFYASSPCGIFCQSVLRNFGSTFWGKVKYNTRSFFGGGKIIPPVLFKKMGPRRIGVRSGFFVRRHFY